MSSDYRKRKRARIKVRTIWGTKLFLLFLPFAITFTLFNGQLFNFFLNSHDSNITVPIPNESFYVLDNADLISERVTSSDLSIDRESELNKLPKTSPTPEVEITIATSDSSEVTDDTTKDSKSWTLFKDYDENGTLEFWEIKQQSLYYLATTIMYGYPSALLLTFFINRTLFKKLLIYPWAIFVELTKRRRYYNKH